MASISYPEIVVALFCFLFLRRLRRKNKVPRNSPLLGMLPDILLHINQIHEICTEVLERNGCTFMVRGPWFIDMDMLITTDPANIHYIMSTKFSNFPKGNNFKQMFDVLGDGIFNSDSDLWRKQRRIAQSLISHRRFYHYLVKTSQEKVEKGLIPILEHASKHGLNLDLQDVFQRFTFDSTCILVTGYDPCALSMELPDIPFSKAMDDVEEALFFRHVVPEKVLKLQKWLGVGKEKKLSEAWQTLDEFIAKYISMKREDISKGTKCDNSGEGIDLLTSYMNENENEVDGLKFNDKFLRDTILNFMIAGRDTTSSALTWFIWLISNNALVEKKIREEIQANIPVEEAQKWRVFETKELNKLVYLHAAICESLRLYPPVPFEHKAPLRPDILPSGHIVGPKMKILFPLYSMGRMTSIWGKDCFEFKPERWISERGGIKHEPSYKFLAFNAGPRACLGKEVAFTQIKLVAAAIIHNYNIHVAEGHYVAPNISIILQMKYGLKVRITKRWA